MFCPNCNQFVAPGEDGCGHCGAVVGENATGEQATQMTGENAGTPGTDEGTEGKRELISPRLA
ncbi:MAG: hypothetical protein M0Z41_13035 [Peptococcaceae bacterium]|nr:hypothetical protein [Peptococcaceae bacterium]